MSDRETKKKDNSAGSKTIWNQGENLAVICGTCCLYEPEEELFTDLC